MRSVHIHDARLRLADLVDAAVAGESVYIEKEPGRVVQLVPVEKPSRHPRFGSARGLVTIRKDFDEPLEDMAEYAP
jgi:antitoxin (DNA-binding transcriptional repressor) of toxin-antitoxin stability system